MNDFVGSSGEGFFEYRTSEADAIGDSVKIISFIKHFQPYDWFIEACLNVDDIEGQLQSDLLLAISKIRFAEDGYTFINRMNGDALVSNGRLVSGKKKLLDIFSKHPEETKAIWQKEYKAALRPGGDFIYYSLIKLTDQDHESPKTSFIHVIPEFQWAVGADVYLDDVEEEIAVLHSELGREMRA